MDNTQDKSKKREVTYINYNIRNPKVRIIDEVTKQQRVMDTNAAISLAQSKGLDLVEIAFDKSSRMPICKIIDYGKFKYMQSKKQKDAKKQARENAIELKTVQFSIATDENDKARLVKQAKEFLSEGDAVKIAIRFRNKRESQNMEYAKQVLKSIVVEFEGLAVLDQAPSVAGRLFSCTLKPLKKGK